MVNLGFDDNKIRFGTNDYISNVIRQEDFRNDNYKDKIKPKRYKKKKKDLKEKCFFQDLSFIGFLYKVVGALGFSCITLLIYASKSSKSNFVLKSFTIG